MVRLLPHRRRQSEPVGTGFERVMFAFDVLILLMVGGYYAARRFLRPT